MKKILIKNATVFSGFLTEKIYKGYDIYIENGIIKDIFKTGSKGYEKAEIIDVRGKIVMPGFINAHMHFYSTLVKGMGGIKKSNDFIEVLKNLWWKVDKAMDEKSTYTSALVGCINAVKNGTTTIIDHHSGPGYIRGSLFKIEEAVRKAGLRACLCYEVSDRDGRKKRDDGIKENEEFIKYSNSKKDPFIKGIFGLHASFTVEDDTLKKSYEIASMLGAGFHVHCAESVKDEEHCIKRYGMRIVERFHRYGITGDKSIFAHCVHTDEKERAILRKTSTAVVFNPQSNANNAVGIADIVEFIKERVIGGIGTDSMTLNMLEELRVAIWLSHLKKENPSTGFQEVITTLKNNVIIARKYFDKVGEISKGCCADIVVFDYIPSTPLTEENFYGHLVFGISQSKVTDVICGGRLLMRNGEIKFVDEEKLYADSRIVAQKLWQRI